MSTLLIDDKKMPQEIGYEVDRIARNYADGLIALAERKWDLLLLDHDLADFSGSNNEERSGVHVLRWLARPENRKHIPGQVICVSKNPIGGGNIVKDIEQLYTNPDELLMLDAEYMRAYYASL